jgi:hypothetical protein
MLLKEISFQEFSLGGFKIFQKLIYWPFLNFPKSILSLHFTSCRAFTTSKHLFQVAIVSSLVLKISSWTDFTSFLLPALSQPFSSLSSSYLSPTLEMQLCSLPGTLCSHKFSGLTHLDIWFQRICIWNTCNVFVAWLPHLCS